MSFAVASGEYGDQAYFKIFEQGSEHTDTHHM